MKTTKKRIKSILAVLAAVTVLAPCVITASAATDKVTVVKDDITVNTLSGGDWQTKQDSKISHRWSGGVTAKLGGYETGGCNVNAFATTKPVTFADDEDLMAEYDVLGVTSSTVHFGVMQGRMLGDTSAWDYNYGFVNTFGYYSGADSTSFTFESASADYKFPEVYENGAWVKAQKGNLDLKEGSYRIRQIYRSAATDNEAAIEIFVAPVSENGVYDTSAEGFWTIEPNWCSTFYGAHFLSTRKQTKERMESGYKYVRFKIKYNSAHIHGAPCIDGVEEYGKTLGKDEFNFFALVHQQEKYLFFNSDDVTERTPVSGSFATDDNGKAASDVTLYDAETGEKVFADGSHGNAISPNKKYILEINAEGDLNGSVALTGIQDALISDVTWSDKIYAEKDGESAVQDTLRVLEMDVESHHLASQRPLFHRLWKTSDGYTGNYKGNCVINNDGAIDTAVAANRSGVNNRCLEFARKIWLASAKTSKEAGKKYFRLTIEWRSFDTIQVGHVVEDKNDENYGRLAAFDFNAFIYSPAGGRYLYLAA